MCLSLADCTHPGITLGNGRGCPLVVHYWADLQSVPRFRCYGHIRIHIHVQYCKGLQCKCILIDVNSIWITLSQVYPIPISQLVLFNRALPHAIWTTPSQVCPNLCSPLPVKFNKACTECKMLARACTCSINWFHVAVSIQSGPRKMISTL